MKPKISAYVPCYNNEKTIIKTVESIQSQTVSVDELFVVDDGSTDKSVAVLKNAGIKVYENGKNKGRGYTRARAMEIAKNELVLCCDATNVLSKDFIEKSLHWFDDQKVAGVYGKMITPAPKNYVERWQNRHMLRLEDKHESVRHSTLITWGTIVRKSVVLKAGNYDPKLKHTEDFELGQKISSCRYNIIYDPNIDFIHISKKLLFQVLERYRRWNSGKDEQVSWKSYLTQIWFSLKVRAVQDIKAKDFLCIPISLFVPHYQFWKSVKEKLKVKQ